LALKSGQIKVKPYFPPELLLLLSFVNFDKPTRET